MSPRRNPSPPDSMAPIFVPLLTAAAKQFGAGVLVAAVFAFGMVRVYADLDQRNRVLVDLVREQTAAARGVESALRELVRSLENSGRIGN